MIKIIWTDYLMYKARLRGFNLSNIEDIIRHSSERYFDTSSRRHIVVGKDAKVLVVIPHDIDEFDTVPPITIHAITIIHINYRVKSGRFQK